MKSVLPGLEWPAMPDEAGALALAVQFQLEQTQWWPREQLEQVQRAQLEQLLNHAYETVPFHRARLAAVDFNPRAELTWEAFRRLPFLTRSEVQEQGPMLCGSRVPPAHGRVRQSETSGSTGSPITYYATDLSQFFWRAFTLREHLWHRRDFSGKLAAIRPKVEDGMLETWGPATDVAFKTGPCALLSIRAEMDAQLTWLQEHAPQYLISSAHNVYGLARRSLELGVRLPSLHQARSYGGVIPEDARETVRRAWGVPLVDLYTAEEVGYIALQCPEHDHYHLQSENLVVELLDRDGRPCAAGAIGKVVISTLHNFAMPLVRYEIGDYAEAGEPCPCGRGLPVIRRILGRQRNLMRLPSGRQRWPSFPSEKWSHLAPVRQLQMIQKSVERIVVRIVAERELTLAEERKLIVALQNCLGYPFAMTVERVVEIPRSPSYKFEDFISEVPS